MEVGQKLRELREEKHLSQGDIQHKTGLLCCYTSRVENGYTVPNVETLEKFAHALEIPLYRFFTDGEKVKMLRPYRRGCAGSAVAFSSRDLGEHASRFLPSTSSCQSTS
jgi:transcriptional regulator with XRE-family HTH domain